jgi:biofilm PGA synthesis N-glycosyltransferase PgaC
VIVASEPALKPETLTATPTYVLVTPARNEARFIEMTIKSVANQTVLPLRWVIVSDGSTDGTDDIVAKYATQHAWIELVRLPEHTQRSFSSKVAAFRSGYSRLAGMKFDVIGNLDGDVSFDEGYLAFLIGKFSDNSRLGVAGTPYREDNPIHDERFKSPDHVSGACQMFRRECFEQIGGYQPSPCGGIDLIALLAAQAKGWETKRFDDRTCLHHRNVGSGDHSGVYSRLLNRGKKDYLLGSHPAFEIFRCVNQMKTSPFVIGGALMLVGYFWAMLLRMERSMPVELIEIRRGDQMGRLKKVLRHALRIESGRITPSIAGARSVGSQANSSDASSY